MKIKCLECQNEFTNMTTHLLKKHDLSKADYLRKYPGAKIVSDNFREFQRNRMKKQYERTDIDYRKIAGSRTFDFINNNRLRLLLQRDYKSAKVCLKNRLWKPTIILYGSLIEAVLREYTGKEKFDIALDAALSNNLISEKEFYKIHLIKDLRNFVHLHEELSEGEEINEHWANTFSDICESIIKRLKKI
ncbi:hypothetical protein HYT18_02580 [Candidatus Microgenomates bacterium]|nr:hypothetical protein [Candidatus Microgenomates bacterium]